MPRNRKTSPLRTKTQKGCVELTTILIQLLPSPMISVGNQEQLVAVKKAIGLPSMNLFTKIN